MELRIRSAEWRAGFQRAGADTAVGVATAVGALGSLALLVVTACFMALFVIGVGAVALPPLTEEVRRHCNAARRAAVRYAIRVEIPYRPAPADVERENAGWLRRCRWILADPASWRDLLWLLLNSPVGLLLGFLPAGLLYYALEGLALAAGLWQPVQRATGAGRWYCFVQVDNWWSAAAAGLLALGVLLGWLWLTPLILKAHGHFTRALLGPTERARLASRVRHLAETRSGALDAQAAELRRIERDLHDGAQARLIGLGLTLGALDRHLGDGSPEARRLLQEARTSSVAALRELRDLVRGIHPPVLAERGLADAVRALAIASPLQVAVAAELPGDPPAPIASAVYFAVAELLANALKYSGAERVGIVAGYQDGVLRLRVSDDGRGGADPAAGTGLAGIRRRLAGFDGTFQISSPQGGPTVTTMEIPCVLSSPKTSTS
ncbi:sensor domain-containing protein [Kitasatospora acidiphila]|uniref:sensor histidine kinase n=1 Tax=Kitasatospora acidiphila TaxID=2567942 RepID=UPI003C76821A